MSREPFVGPEVMLKKSALSEIKFRVGNFVSLIRQLSVSQLSITAIGEMLAKF